MLSYHFDPSHERVGDLKDVVFFHSAAGIPQEFDAFIIENPHASRLQSLERSPTDFFDLTLCQESVMGAHWDLKPTFIPFLIIPSFVEQLPQFFLQSDLLGLCSGLSPLG